MRARITPNLRTTLITSAFTLVGMGVYAQQKTEHTDTVRISLQTSLDTAIARYPSIKAAMAEKKGAAQDVKAARTAYVPALKIQEQVTYSSANGMVGTFWPNEGVALPTSGATRNEQIWTGSYGQYSTAFLTGPIFSFGKISSEVQASKARQSIADAQYENEIFQHKIKVTESYLYLLVYQKLKIVQKQNLQRALDVYSFIRASVQSGLKPGVDSSYASAEVSKARINYLASLRDEQTWQIKFGEMIGMTGNYFIVDTMTFNSSLPLVDNNPGTIENNPIIAIYRNKTQADVYAAKATRRSYLPTLKYMAMMDGRGSGISNTNDRIYSQSISDGVSLQRYNYLFGAYLLWDAFGFFRTEHEYKSKLFDVQRDNAMIEEARLNLNQKLENSNEQLKLAIEQAKEAPIQLNAASSSYSQSKARYSSGLSNLIELSQSQYLLTRAEADYSITYNNTWRSLLSKAAAIGDFNVFMEKIKK